MALQAETRATAPRSLARQGSSIKEIKEKLHGIRTQFGELTNRVKIRTSKKRSDEDARSMIKDNTLERNSSWKAATKAVKGGFTRRSNGESTLLPVVLHALTFVCVGMCVGVCKCMVHDFFRAIKTTNIAHMAVSDFISLEAAAAAHHNQVRWCICNCSSGTFVLTDQLVSYKVITQVNIVTLLLTAECNGLQVGLLPDRPGWIPQARRLSAFVIGGSNIGIMICGA